MGHTSRLLRIELLALGVCGVAVMLAACGQVRVRVMGADEIAQVIGSASYAPSLTATFSLSTAQVVPPADVLTQTSIWAEVPGFDPFFQCSDNPGHLPEVTVQNQVLGPPPKVIELLSGLTVIVEQPCDVTSETVQLTITYPDGRHAIRYDEEHPYTFKFDTEFGDPPGTYRFTVNTSNGTAFATVEVIPADGPRVHIREAYGPEATYIDDLVLHNFAPGERIRLLAYGGSDQEGLLLGWDEFSLDSEGRRIIEVTSTEPLAYAVVSDQSGRVPVEGSFYWLGEVLSHANVLAFTNVDSQLPPDVLARVVSTNQSAHEAEDGPCPMRQTGVEEAEVGEPEPVLRIEWSDLLPIATCASSLVSPVTATVVVPNGRVMHLDNVWMDCINYSTLFTTTASASMTRWVTTGLSWTLPTADSMSIRSKWRYQTSHACMK